MNITYYYQGDKVGEDVEAYVNECLESHKGYQSIQNYELQDEIKAKRVEDNIEIFYNDVKLFSVPIKSNELDSLIDEMYSKICDQELEILLIQSEAMDHEIRELNDIEETNRSLQSQFYPL